MIHHPLTYLLLFATALAAGAINSVAGGGTLLTFPALLTVLSPIGANATSTVALVPGSLSAFWGYRHDLERGRGELLRLGLPSLLGGLVGAKLVLHVGDALFSHLVPWLILGATVLFMVQEPVRRWITRGEGSRGAEVAAPLADGSDVRADAPEPRRGFAGVMVFQFFVAVYGGFFGAGIGILMLAALGFLGLSNIHRMNGLKNFAAICINGVAATTFIVGGKVDWPLALLMMAGAILGGYGGAGVAKRMGQQNVRRVVVAIGLIIGVTMLVRQIGGL